MAQVEIELDSGTLPTAGRAIRNASVYAFATTLRGAIGLLLLPLYTRVLSPSEYGRLAIILTMTTGVAILLSFGLDYALFRNFFRLASDPPAQRRLVNSLWTFLMVVPLGVVLMLSAAVTPWLSSAGVVRPLELTVGLLAAALAVSATTVPLALLRVQERMRDFVILSVVYTGTSAAATLTLVVGFNAGVGGWLFAMLIASVAAFIAALRIVPWQLPKPFDRGLVREGLVLGLPLVPHFLGHWALLLADRAVLGGMVSTANVGVYTLAATLALPAQMLVQALSQAFMPSYAAAASSGAARTRLPKIVTVQAVSVLLLCLSVALLGPSVVTIMAPPAYEGAAPLIPWIALGYLFLGLYSIPMSGLSLGAGRTKFVWVATAGAACTNIGLLYVFVPAHGILAAAIASACGYLVLLVAIGWHSRVPDNPATYEWGRLVRALCIAAAVYVAAILTTEPSGSASALLRLAWLVVAGAGLILVGVVNTSRTLAVLGRLRSDAQD